EVGRWTLEARGAPRRLGPPVPSMPARPGQDGPQRPGPDDGAMVVRRSHRRDDRLASKRMRPSLVRPARPRRLSTGAKQLIRSNAECLGDLGHDRHCWIPNAAFYSTDIGPVQLGLERQFLLREFPPLPQASYIDTHLLPDIHASEQAVLQTIDLQTMSLI